MTKETINITSKDHSNVPSFIIDFEPHQRDLIGMSHGTVEKFLQIISVAKFKAARSRLFALGVISIAKLKFYKFIIERDFELHMDLAPLEQEYKQDNGEWYYYNLYKRFSKSVFNSNRKLKNLFHAVRTNNLDELRQFVADNYNNLDVYFNVVLPHPPQKQAIYIAAFYGYETIFDYLLQQGLYSKLIPELRSVVLTAAAAGGHFNIFQKMFKGFTYQYSMYLQLIQDPPSLQSNEFNMFHSLDFLVVAIGRKQLPFVTQFNDTIKQAKEESSKQHKEYRQFLDKYSNRVFSYVGENLTPWPNLGFVLTAKTAALHTGSLEVIDFVSKSLRYSWEQQIKDICTFMQENTFEELFSKAPPINQDFSDLEKILFVVCFEALQAITQKFSKKEIQFKLLNESYSAYKKTEFAFLFQIAASEFLKQLESHSPAYKVLKAFLEGILLQQQQVENKENMAPKRQDENASVQALTQGNVTTTFKKAKTQNVASLSNLQCEESLESTERLSPP